MFGRRSRRVAKQLAAGLGGRVDPAFAQIGLFRVARHNVVAQYKRMKVQVFVRAPHAHIWAEGFRMRMLDETVFCVNQPDRVMLLHGRVDDAFGAYRAPVYIRAGSADATMKAFCRAPDNEADIVALGISGKESLLVNQYQLILRSRTPEADAILARIDILGRIIARNS